MVDIGKAGRPGHAFNAGGPGKSGVEQVAVDRTVHGQEKISDVDVKLTMKAKMVEFLLVVKKESQEGFAAQQGVVRLGSGEGLDLDNMLYNGTPLAELSPDEAQVLIGEDGYFGIAQTAQRIADFVLNGAGDNLNRLMAGRDGVQQGFAEAEEVWGGTLPDISYDTLAKTLELIDARIGELGGALVDVHA